jgi:hypothetical protein
MTIRHPLPVLLAATGLFALVGVADATAAEAGFTVTRLAADHHTLRIGITQFGALPGAADRPFSMAVTLPHGVTATGLPDGCVAGASARRGNVLTCDFPAGLGPRGDAVVNLPTRTVADVPAGSVLPGGHVFIHGTGGPHGSPPVRHSVAFALTTDCPAGVSPPCCARTPAAARSASATVHGHRSSLLRPVPRGPARRWR